LSGAPTTSAWRKPSSHTSAVPSPPICRVSAVGTRIRHSPQGVSQPLPDSWPQRPNVAPPCNSQPLSIVPAIGASIGSSQCVRTQEKPEFMRSPKRQRMRASDLHRICDSRLDDAIRLPWKQPQHRGQQDWTSHLPEMRAVAASCIQVDKWTARSADRYRMRCKKTPYETSPSHGCQA
jgi:hypothetical protein